MLYLHIKLKEMKASELRIGNFIKRIGTPPIETVEVITELSIETDFNNFLGAEHFEAIPLTEEWLLKFGFVLDGDLWLLEDFYIKIEDDEWEIGWAFGIGEPIRSFKYVHTLQNIYFALEDKELCLIN